MSVSVLESTVATPTHRYVLPFAPPMPPGFYGSVRFDFQDGKLVAAAVEEKLKPTA